MGIADCKKDINGDAAGGAWGKRRRESHCHVAPGFPLGPVTEHNTLYGGEVLTLTVSLHIVRDSCMAMRQKAVMEGSESLPCTSP